MASDNVVDLSSTGDHIQLHSSLTLENAGPGVGLVLVVLTVVVPDPAPALVTTAVAAPPPDTAPSVVLATGLLAGCTGTGVPPIVGVRVPEVCAIGGGSRDRAPKSTNWGIEKSP